jgi:hypothetical protein
MDLIRFLDHQLGGSWKSLAGEYGELHHRLSGVTEQVIQMKQRRFEIYGEIRKLRRERADAEREKGRHFREALFEKPKSDSANAQRQVLSDRIELLIHQTTSLLEKVHASIREQRQVVADPQVHRVHERRREIEMEAELKRMRLIRNAVIVSRGLVRAGYRPSAWWFPILCPSGHWFTKTVEEASCYLEPLSPKPVGEEGAHSIFPTGLNEPRH